MNHLRKFGILSLLFLVLGLVAGALPGSVTGWTPKSAMIVALICYGLGVVLALIAFMQSKRSQSLDGATKFLTRAPLSLITIGVLILFLRAMTGW
jgi:ribose/xylose/arabinose/galactoside ABC-type transport system permease subunit